MPGSPSAANVGNVLTAQAILFDSELIPNLKGETNAFMELYMRRTQPTGEGINRTLFQYDELGADTAQAADGVVDSPEFIGQVSIPAQIGEWNNFSNFSAFSVAAAIDDLVGNSGIELGYQCGQTISELYSATLDSASTVDSNVNQSSLLSSPYTMTLPIIREMKQQLVSIGVLPKEAGKYHGAISPNVLGDLWNGTTVNASAIDFWKYTKEGQEMFDRLAGADQMVPIELPGTGIVFYQTPFVLKTSNYQSTGSYGYRTYIAGAYAGIGIWMQVPGDTDLGDGDWRDIETKVVKNAASSAFDPVATVGAWCSYRFHQTTTLPPAPFSANTQRVRWADSVPAIQ